MSEIVIALLLVVGFVNGYFQRQRICEALLKALELQKECIEVINRYGIRIEKLEKEERIRGGEQQ